MFLFFFWAVLGGWDWDGMGWDGLKGRGGLLYWYLEKEKGGCECGLFLGRGGGEGAGELRGMVWRKSGVDEMREFWGFCFRKVYGSCL